MKTNQIEEKSSSSPTILVAARGAGIFGVINTKGLRGYDVQTAEDGASALLMLPRVSPNLIVLDVDLAKVNWFEFYKSVRNDPIHALTPILILVNTTEDVTGVSNFSLGNTDFVVKPVAPQELLVRMRRLLYLRQSADGSAGLLDYDDLRLDVPRHEVRVKGHEINLTVTEFKLLVTLAQRRGRVQSRERLLQDVCDYFASAMETRTIDTHVRRLRSKLGTARWHVETVRGIGYRFLEKPMGGKQPDQTWELSLQALSPSLGISHRPLPITLRSHQEAR
jgi:two-component system phosphate regulon response regulator PhoB